MAVSYVNSSTGAFNFGSGTTTSTPGWPASINSGDLLVLFVYQSTNSAISGVPAGWTSFFPDITQPVSGVSSEYYSIWWKIADGTENTQPTFTLTVSPSQGFGSIIHHFTGNMTTGTPILRTHRFNPINNQGGSSLGAIPVHGSGSLICVFTEWNVASPTGPSANWTRVFNNTNAGWVSLWTCSTPATPGWTDPFGLTLPGNTMGGVWYCGFEILAAAVGSFTSGPPRLVAREVNNWGNALTTIQVRLPQGRQVGNLLIVYFTIGSKVPAPSGWNFFHINSLNVSSNHMNIYTRVIDGTEPDLVTIGPFAIANVLGCFCQEWSFAPTQLPPTQNLQPGTAYSAAASPVTNAGTTTLRDNAIAMAFSGLNQGLAVDGLGNGWVRLAQWANGEALSFKPMPTAGATGALTETDITGTATISGTITPFELWPPITGITGPQIVWTG